jgi:carbonic anhydrase
MKTIALTTLLATVEASAYTYDYATNGYNWPELEGDDNECGGKAQSPIDLSYKNRDWDFFGKQHAWSTDEMTREYTNPIDAIVNWNGHTSQTNLDVSSGGPKNQFTSKLAESVFGADTTFNGQQFHFHA